jgi:hypothetical protein
MTKRYLPAIGFPLQGFFLLLSAKHLPGPWFGFFSTVLTGGGFATTG